jgi:hypothetical protein
MPYLAATSPHGLRRTDRWLTQSQPFPEVEKSQ